MILEICYTLILSGLILGFITAFREKKLKKYCLLIFLAIALFFFGVLSLSFNLIFIFLFMLTLILCREVAKQ